MESVKEYKNVKNFASIKKIMKSSRIDSIHNNVEIKGQNYEMHFDFISHNTDFFFFFYNFYFLFHNCDYYQIVLSFFNLRIFFAFGVCLQKQD